MESKSDFFGFSSILKSLKKKVWPACPVNCVGSFSVCNSNCEYTWSVTQEQKGSGTACDYAPGDVEACSGGDCPAAVNCSLSDWGACSESCGSGTQTRTKTEAQNGGTDCTGDVTVERSCNSHVCPVNCVGGWATCNVDCVEIYGHSVEAVGTGTACDEVAGAERSCSGGQCPTPINCAMSDWGTCSEPCGGGTQTRTKTPAQHGGQDCTGDTSLSRACNEPASYLFFSSKKMTNRQF